MDLRAELKLRSTMLVVACLMTGWPSVLGAGEKPKTMSGHGGFPLTDTVSSMWGAIDEPVAEGDKPLTFIIYFRGRPGWHDRKWTMNVRTGDEPAVIEFKSDPVVLHAEYTRKTGTLSLFGRQVKVATTNVVLVDHIDEPGKEAVFELGRVSLHVPPDSNPAIYVLKQSDAIRIRVLGRTDAQSNGGV
jgi:hypothetical protein